MREALTEVAIVGAGLVGCSWAVEYSLGGARVRVFDQSEAIRSSVLARVKTMLADMEAAGLAENVDAALARISIADSLAAAVTGADYVQESVFERVDVKTAVAREIGALISADTIVGSSSSGIPASAFTAEAPHRERFVIAHPLNPPHLAPIVELVPAPWTAPDVVPWLRERLTEIGKVPIEVKREVDGFILNRLQGALLNEAWALYEEGYATTADIDATVSQGLGLRWAFMGPFETIDLNAPGGVADYAERLSPLYFRIAEQRKTPRKWSPELVERIARERRAALPLEDLPKRSQWRDRRLVQLVAHLRRQRAQDQG
jgi:3-hydroxyacyl-CoA dehydrogenase